MKVVIAVDSFKGSLTSLEAGNAVKAGILSAREADTVVCPLADGGEGTTKTLVDGMGGTYVDVEVTGPLGEPVLARYGILEEDHIAVIEMAQASGITLVPRENLDPWKATTYGVGEMIRDAISHGCRDFIIGIGGSCTTEGGIGMLSALGYVFYDENGDPLPPVLNSLGKIDRVDSSGVIPELEECHFEIACDVNNPLCGPNGAAYIYGPQKGVRPDERAVIDRLLLHFAEKTMEMTGRDHSLVSGAGASGGLGFAFMSYFPHAELKSGITIVLDALHMEDILADADYVITGEGSMDAQTAMGKVPVGLAHLAKQFGCKVIAFTGNMTDDAIACNDEGIDAIFPIERGVTTLEEAMNPENAKKNLTLAAEQVFRLL